MLEKNVLVLVKDLKYDHLYMIVPFKVFFNAFWNEINEKTDEFQITLISQNYRVNDFRKIPEKAWFHPVEIEMEADVNLLTLEDVLLNKVLLVELQHVLWHKQ